MSSTNLLDGLGAQNDIPDLVTRLAAVERQDEADSQKVRALLDALHAIEERASLMKNGSASFLDFIVSTAQTAIEGERLPAMTGEDALRNLATDASPAPWRFSGQDLRAANNHLVLMVNPSGDVREQSQHDKDYLLAVNPQAILELLDEVRSLRRQLVEAGALHQQLIRAREQFRGAARKNAIQISSSQDKTA